MTKILTLAALLGVILTGCQHGYFRLNEGPRQNTNWAAISEVVGQKLNK